MTKTIFGSFVLILVVLFVGEGCGDARSSSASTQQSGAASLSDADLAPPPPPPPPPPPTKLELFRRDIASGAELGGWCEQVNEAVREVCRGLDRASKTGSTDSSSRGAFQQFLSSSGAKQRSGFMVARMEDNLYEVQMRGEQNHAILITTVTTFSSRGMFNIWVRERGSRTIDTINGFSQEWNIYEEDEIGGLVHHVRRAQRGDDTATQARDAMLLLIADNLDE